MVLSSWRRTKKTVNLQSKSAEACRHATKETDRMEVFLVISGILLLLFSLYFCIRPHIPAVIPAYGGIWLLQWSGMLHFPSVMLSYWGIMVMLVIITLSMLPQPLVKATQGMTHITVSSLAGMLLGMTFGYAPMIIGAFVGAVAGAVFFSRTPGGAGLKFPSSRFVQYFCAKGLPAVIVVCLFGIAIEVAVLQHFYQP